MSVYNNTISSIEELKIVTSDSDIINYLRKYFYFYYNVIFEQIDNEINSYYKSIGYKKDNSDFSKYSLLILKKALIEKFGISDMYCLSLDNIKIIILFENIIFEQMDLNDKKIREFNNVIEEAKIIYYFFLDLIRKEKINLDKYKVDTESSDLKIILKLPLDTIDRNKIIVHIEKTYLTPFFDELIKLLKSIGDKD